MEEILPLALRARTLAHAWVTEAEIIEQVCGGGRVTEAEIIVLKYERDFKQLFLSDKMLLSVFFSYWEHGPLGATYSDREMKLYV